MAVEIDYPDDLACVSRIDGYAFQASAAVMRTPFGVGASHQRRGHMQMPMQMQIAWRVNNEQLQPLFAWLNQYGYDWFNIDLSGVESSRLNLFKSAMAIRLITDINIALIQIHRQNWYIVSSSAEYYPPLIDRTYVAPLFLSIDEALHAHAADSLSLATPILTLGIHDAFHGHTADNVTMESLNPDLSIADALHAHAADNIVLTDQDLLIIDDATHAHTADQSNVVPAVPADLEAAHWYDFTDPSTMYTDESGTLVSADGDQIKVIRDKNGQAFCLRQNNNWMTYETGEVPAGPIGRMAGSGTLHRTLRATTVAGGGVPTGSDLNLSAIFTNGKNSMVSIFVVKLTADGTVRGTISDLTGGYYFGRSTISAGSHVFMVSCFDSGSNKQVSKTITNSTWAVFTWRQGATQNELRVNGGSWSSVGCTGPQTLGENFRFGQGFTSNPMVGDIAHLVMSADLLSDAELLAIEQYLGATVGLTI